MPSLFCIYLVILIQSIYKNIKLYLVNMMQIAVLNFSYILVERVYLVLQLEVICTN